MKGAVGVVESLELSFRFKDKDKLVSGSDEVLNDFVVCKESKADLVLGMPWLWLRETKIDPHGKRISIYVELYHSARIAPAPLKMIDLDVENHKHRKRRHGIFHNTPPAPLLPRRMDDNVSKHSKATKNKKYPKVDLGDGCGNLSIKTHLNNIGTKQPWIKSETNSSSSDSESTGSDWYDLNPIKSRKNRVHISEASKAKKKK
ncbi:10165_t:CDS:2, partial [Paraglomus occultum]